MSEYLNPQEHSDSNTVTDLAQEANQTINDQQNYHVVRSMDDIDRLIFSANPLLANRFPVLDVKQTDSSRTSANTSLLFEQRFFSEKIRGEQEPFETMLELILNFAALEPDAGNLDSLSDEFGCNYYLFTRHTKLRRLLFCNPYQDYFDSQNLSDDEKWQQWSENFINSNTRSTKASNKKSDEQPVKGRGKQKLSSVYRVFTNEDIDRLRQQFDSFSDFTKTITFLRSWSFINDNKQWSYNFLFPFGPDCIFDEVTIDHASKSNYLSGAGLLLFSMMQRANEPEKFKKICHEIHARFLNQDNVFNILAQNLEGIKYQQHLEKFRADVKNGTIPSNHTYEISPKHELNSLRAVKTLFLPYKNHRVFNQQLNDYYNLLTLNTPLNQQDLFNALSMINALNLICYYLEITQQVNELAGISSNIDMVVECNHDRGKNLRRLSVARLSDNDALIKQSSRNMLMLYMTHLFPNYTAESKISRDEFVQVMDTIEQAFSLNYKFKQDHPFESFCQDSSSELADFGSIHKVFAKYLEQQAYHLNGLHRNYCRYIGLTSKSHSNAYRYMLSDELVRVLVLTTVDHDEQLMLLDDFLARLYSKYHLVIGPKEGNHYCISAKTVTSSIEDSIFTYNLSAFKEQLSRLGFLINLSDTSAYIKNPYLN